jgi:hypothetical protein
MIGKAGSNPQLEESYYHSQLSAVRELTRAKREKSRAKLMNSKVEAIRLQDDFW